MSDWILIPLLFIGYICCGTVTHIIMLHRCGDKMDMSDGDINLILFLWPVVVAYNLLRSPLAVPNKIIRAYGERLRDKKHREETGILSTREYQAKIKQLEKDLAEALLIGK